MPLATAAGDQDRAGAPAGFTLRQDDVVAFLGGETVVQELEQGHLESLLTAAFPGTGIRYRNLAWEGDTVFEQPRDVNFPGVPEQLERVGATVVFCQFGQAESLAGKDGLPAFVAAYEKLLDAVAAPPRRAVLVTPLPFERPANPLLPDLSQRNADLGLYVHAIRELATRRGVPVADVFGTTGAGQCRHALTDNGMRPTPRGVACSANRAFASLDPGADDHPAPQADEAGRWDDPELEALRLAIVEKNRLWFEYWRPMNWAFLGGDRTTVPSSFAPGDMTTRIFPAEIERYVPLIERAEARVAELARAAGPGDRTP
jgi:hypothetical protein